MKKIMFNDRYGLTQAVLDGRKTQTRRIIPEPMQDKLTAASMPVLMIPFDAVLVPEGMDMDKFVEERIKQPNRPILVKKGEPHIVQKNVDMRPSIIKLHSRYQVGEVVAVAQSYKKVFTQMDLSKRKGSLADTITGAAWDNKMFVEADPMPHQIRITNVRLERLQDITDVDCIREGVIRYTCNLYEYVGVCYSFVGDREKMGTYKTPCQAFAAMIDKISGKGTWDKNPWVFAYDFELIK